MDLDFGARYIALGTQVVEACYADDAPAARTAKFKLLTFVNGVLTDADDIAPPADHDRLVAAGCSIR